MQRSFLEAVLLILPSAISVPEPQYQILGSAKEWRCKLEPTHGNNEEGWPKYSTFLYHDGGAWNWLMRILAKLEKIPRLTAITDAKGSVAVPTGDEPMLVTLAGFAPRMRKFYVFILLGVALFAALFLLSNVDHFASLKRLQAISGGVTILNVMESYDVETVFNSMAAYGAEGRLIYARILLYDVIVLIPAYVAFLLVGTLDSGRKLFRGRFLRLVGLVALLPFVAAAMNLFEDALVYKLIVDYPEQSSPVASLLPMITPTKAAIMKASLIVVLAAYVAAAIRWLLARMTQAKHMVSD